MQPNATSEQNTNSVQPYKTGVLDDYLTFCALGGLIVDDNGNVSHMTQDKFCREHNVDRSTLMRWKKQIPDFADRQRKRRDEIVPLARETAAFNRLYLIGMSSLGNGSLHHDQRAAVDALKTYTGHYSNLQLPVQRQDVKVSGGFAEMLSAAQNQGVIEGELVNGPSTDDTGASEQNTPALPATP